MKSLVVIAGLVGGAGCFYSTPINQRPALEIQDDGAVLHRGQTVHVHAIKNDPESQEVTVHWVAYRCGADPASDADCDTESYSSSTDDDVFFAIPAERADGSPTEGILITLDGRDARGAGAKPQQVLTRPVDNAEPTIQAVANPSFQSVVGTEVRLFAEFGDIDDGADHVTLTWEVFSPMEHPFDDLTDIPANQVPTPDNLAHRQVGKRFIPTSAGTWSARITATDPLGAHASIVVPFNVAADTPPCITGVAPAAPPIGSTLPISEPTLFAVQNVEDDLDAYPSDFSGADGDPRGETEFQWSLLEPNGTRRLIPGAVANTFPVDPAAYPAGSTVEVRVEIQDRSHTALTCADDASTCSVISSPACIQRQTWRVEIR